MKVGIAVDDGVDHAWAVDGMHSSSLPMLHSSYCSSTTCTGECRIRRMQLSHYNSTLMPHRYRRPSSRPILSLTHIRNLILMLALIRPLLVMTSRESMWDDTQTETETHATAITLSSSSPSSSSSSSLPSSSHHHPRHVDAASSDTSSSSVSVTAAASIYSASPWRLLLFHCQQLGLLLSTTTSMPAFLASMLSVFNSGSTGFSLSSLYAMECIGREKWTLATQCWMTVITPMVIVGIAAVNYYVEQWRQRNRRNSNEHASSMESASASAASSSSSSPPSSNSGRSAAVHGVKDAPEQSKRR